MAGLEHETRISQLQELLNTKITRRELLSLAGLTLIACQPKEGEKKDVGYPLERAGSELVDKILEDQKGVVSRFAFRFDPGYAGGSLLLHACFREKGWVRIISRELAPKPGYLVDKPYSYEANCLDKYPVTRLAVGDREEVLVGIDKDQIQTYKNMRVYEIRRTSQGLEGEFKKMETVDPATIKLRN